jgi:hypothetical protein
MRPNGGNHATVCRKEPAMRMHAALQVGPTRLCAGKSRRCECMRPYRLVPCNCVQERAGDVNACGLTGRSHALVPGKVTVNGFDPTARHGLAFCEAQVSRGGQK